MIPVNRPVITKIDAKSVYNVTKSGWISSGGPQIKIFENKFKKFIGKNYASTVTSGTAALEISLKCLNLCVNWTLSLRFGVFSTSSSVIPSSLLISAVIGPIFLTPCLSFETPKIPSRIGLNLISHPQYLSVRS